MNRTLIRRSLLVLAIVLASDFAIVRSPVHLGLDLRGGASLIVRVKMDDVPPAQCREVVEQTRQILERRINAYGLSEAPVQPYGNRGNELLVQHPGVSDPSRIENLLQSRAVLEWYSVEEGPYASTGDAMARHGGLLPYNQRLLPARPAADGQRPWYLLDRQPIIRGTDLRGARVSAGTMEQPVSRKKGDAGNGEGARGAGESFSTETEAGPKGQAGTEVPVLCVVRPDLSDGCVGSGMGAGASQQGCARHGWRHDPADCDVRPRRSGISGRHSGSAAHENLPAAGGATRVHSESEWEAEAVGNTDGARPGSTNGDPTDPGADL